MQVKTLSKPLLKERRMEDDEDDKFTIKKQRDPDARTGKVLITRAS